MVEYLRKTNVDDWLKRIIMIFWGVLEITYSQDATTDIDAKYVIRRGSVQGCAFWGSQNHTLTSTPPFSPKTAILGPDYDGT